MRYVCPFLLSRHVSHFFEKDAETMRMGDFRGHLLSFF